MIKREAVAQTRSVKKEFLEILQRSQENTCARVSGDHSRVSGVHRKTPVPEPQLADSVKNEHVYKKVSWQF